jgi:hypothetical protein
MLGLIALLAFFGAAARLWVMDGAFIPVCAIGLWILAFFLFPILGLNGYVFMAFEALAAAILLIIERFKSAMQGY